MQAWVFFIILAVFGVGMLWGFAVGRSKNASLRRAEQLETELTELRDHSSEYKQQVSQHFAKTADVVNAMTSNYRALYDQLIKGAQDLCGDQQASAKLDPSQVRYIEHRHNINENKGGLAPNAANGPSSGPAPAVGGIGAAGAGVTGNGEPATAAPVRPGGAAAPAQGGSVIEQAVQQRHRAKANGEAAGEEKRSPDIEVIAQATEEAGAETSHADGGDAEDKAQVQAKSPQAETDKPGAAESLTVH